MKRGLSILYGRTTDWTNRETIQQIANLSTCFILPLQPARFLPFVDLPDSKTDNTNKIDHANLDTRVTQHLHVRFFQELFANQNIILCTMFHRPNALIARSVVRRASSSLSSVWNPTEEHVALRESLRSFVLKEVRHRLASSTTIILVAARVVTAVKDHQLKRLTGRTTSARLQQTRSVQH